MNDAFSPGEGFGFDVSSVFRDSSCGKVLFGKGEEVEGFMGVFGEVDDPEVGYEPNHYTSISGLRTDGGSG